MSEEPFRALLKIKEIKNKVIKKGKNDEERDMEDGDTDGDIHSDGGSDRTGYDIVYGPRAFLKAPTLKQGRTQTYAPILAVLSAKV